MLRKVLTMIGIFLFVREGRLSGNILYRQKCKKVLPGDPAMRGERGAGVFSIKNFFRKNFLPLKGSKREKGG